MPVSLHNAVIASYQQMLPQVSRLLDKAQAHCAQTGAMPDELAQTCLAPDMWPFSKQIEQIAHHSHGALVAVREGSFAPKPGDFPHDFAAMRREIDEAKAAVDAIGEEELEAIAGDEVIFRIASFDMRFTVANFLLSFSLPNFYFHVTTAYNILRMSGVALGKPDYLGKLRSEKG